MGCCESDFNKDSVTPENGVYVVYCGGWGYEKKFTMLSDALRADGVKANIKGEPTPGVTGQFLVWSNK